MQVEAGMMVVVRQPLFGVEGFTHFSALVAHVNNEQVIVTTQAWGKPASITIHRDWVLAEIPRLDNDE